MADWTNIDPNTLLPGEPWTSAKALASFENVSAMAEGAVGAPKVQGVALGGVYLGSFALAVPAVTITGMDRMKTIKLESAGGFVGAVGFTLLIAFSADGGATFGSNSNVFSVTASGIVLSSFIDIETGLTTTNGLRFTPDAIGVSSSATLTVPTSTNAIRLTSIGGTAMRVNVMCFGGVA